MHRFGAKDPGVSGVKSVVKSAVRILTAAMAFGLLLVGLQAGSATVGTAAATPLPAPGPEPVTVGVFVQNVQRVDLATNSFSADFYVWLRWRNPDIDAPAGIEVQNIFESANFTKT